MCKNKITHLLYVLFYHVYLNFYRLENFLALHPYKLNVDYAHTRSYEAVNENEIIQNKCMTLNE